MMQYKILFSLLIFPAIILGMEDAEKMVQVRTMKEVKNYVGELIACKPRTKLGESLVDENGRQLNLAFINPAIGTFLNRETQVARQYYYFHVLNRSGNSVVTRVISENTLLEEPLMLRLANAQERKYVFDCLNAKKKNFPIDCLKNSKDDIYAFEFVQHPHYHESCSTRESLNLSHKELRNAIGTISVDAAVEPDVAIEREQFVNVKI